MITLVSLGLSRTFTNKPLYTKTSTATKSPPASVVEISNRQCAQLNHQKRLSDISGGLVTIWRHDIPRYCTRLAKKSGPSVE